MDLTEERTDEENNRVEDDWDMHFLQLVCRKYHAFISTSRLNPRELFTH
jgi:hypothetical protein